ncbi:MAG: hypothetical protein IKL28_10095 [Lachnospiraceae bacterium]|nr:hypothetical protein [Lachnospiraceae bacterium]
MRQGILLSNADDLEDLSAKCNIAYIICAILGALLLGGELGFIVGAVVGLFFGWVIKGPIILKSATYKFRTMEFRMPLNVTLEDIYTAVSPRLRSREIYSTLQGNELEFQHGSIHYQFLEGEEEGTFRLRWYFSAGKALFGERYVRDYKMVRQDTGLIAYMIQNAEDK